VSSALDLLDTLLIQAGRYWWIKLRALTDIKYWDQLEAFSKSKKSPIGYEAFVRHLVSKGHGKQAATYVPRCDASKRGELYAACGEYMAAGREFKERGDKAGLAYVHLNGASCGYLRIYEPSHYLGS